jgi:type IX secretion system PorP/SprF family membrane protein
LLFLALEFKYLFLLFHNKSFLFNFQIPLRMKKIAILLVLVVCGAIGKLSAQQNPMFTKYFFNALAYNPAYAGSANALSVTALYRNQWITFGNGAPKTYTVSVHSPLRNEKVALGFNLVHDEIGPSSHTIPMASFAYRIKAQGGKSTLSFGLQGGIDWYRSNLRSLIPNLQNQVDPNFQVNPNQILPNFGAGIYYQAPKWFAGFSAPFLINNELRTVQNTGAVGIAKQYRHYNLSAGLILELSKNVVFRPMALWKNVGMFMEKADGLSYGAPNELDLDASFLFNKSLWLGAAYRTALESPLKAGVSSPDSFDVWFQYLFKNGLRLGAAYDYHLTPLQQVSTGSFEIMLGYDFGHITKDKIVHVRYF